MHRTIKVQGFYDLDQNDNVELAVRQHAAQLFRLRRERAVTECTCRNKYSLADVLHGKVTRAVAGKHGFIVELDPDSHGHKRKVFVAEEAHAYKPGQRVSIRIVGHAPNGHSVPPAEISEKNGSNNFQ